MILTADQFVTTVGAVEADNIAGIGNRDSRTLDLPRIEAAASAAHQTIMGYIAARYPAPPVSEMLKGYAVDICLYRLRLKTGDLSGVNEEVRKRYEAAIKALEAIAQGKLLLDGAPDGGATSADALGSGVVLAAGVPPRASSILEGYV